MAGGEGRLSYEAIDVAADNAQAAQNEGRISYEAVDVVGVNPQTIDNEGRLSYEGVDVVGVNSQTIINEGRLSYEAIDVIASNTMFYVELSAEAMEVSSALADLSSHVVVPDPLRIPQHHVVKSLSVRITTIGGLHD